MRKDNLRNQVESKDASPEGRRVDSCWMILLLGTLGTYLLE
jgi:hypothetical protein